MLQAGSDVGRKKRKQPTFSSVLGLTLVIPRIRPPPVPGCSRTLSLYASNPLKRGKRLWLLVQSQLGSCRGRPMALTQIGSVFISGCIKFLKVTERRSPSFIQKAQASMNMLQGVKQKVLTVQSSKTMVSQLFC